MVAITAAVAAIPLGNSTHGPPSSAASACSYATHVGLENRPYVYGDAAGSPGA